MKLLFLNTDIGYAGAEKMIVWVANQCALCGHNVTFLTYRNNEINQYVEPQVNLIHEPLEDIQGRSRILRTAKWLHCFIKKERFDIAVAFLSPSQLRLALACIGTRTRYVFSQRGDPNVKNRGVVSSITSLFNRIAFKSADAIVFQTKQAKEYYEKYVQEKSVIIPNPVKPLERTIQREGNIKNVIVSVGRLQIWQKRQDLLIRAFNKICKLYPDVVLEIYGTGPDEDALRVLAANNPRIHFMGKTTNVVECVQNSRMFVLSSDFEGIPNALLEAMSLGVPCISTDCTPGGAALLIDNMRNGLLTQRGNVDGLVEAIRFVLDNPVKAEEMGFFALEVNEIYSEKEVAKKWLTLFDQVSEHVDINE